MYAYDNDLDTYNGCSAATTGVNIYAMNVTNTALALAVDTALDDGNLSCGKLRMGGTSLYYSLSASP